MESGGKGSKGSGGKELNNNQTFTNFKVVWDTLQYFQGSQDSKKEL